MFTPGEIRAGLIGSWQLLKGDPRGMTYFDTSIEGFFRSFWVFVLLLVPFAISIGGEYKMEIAKFADPRGFPTIFYIVMQAIAYLVMWFAFPAVLALLARPLGIAERYVPYIVARNWTSTIGTLVYLVPTLLFLADLLSMKALSGHLLFALLFNLYYSFVVTRIAAGTPIGFSIGLVMLDFVLTLLVNTVVERLIGI
ncbi:hypothetical protein [Methyloraptor flagellatus]|uniref:Yip1 domain-containing protein n=1 Tax=Methyloraptor flagellatus TaxID=3162530 RepID=A0AAU7X6J1_9HYPH